MGTVRIGISGWSYDKWRGDFYPPDLPRRRQLEYAASKLDSVEINGSFYSLLKPDTYRAWYEQTPRGFVFAVKGSRFITHNKKLRDVEVPLANFFASGVLRLDEKLGPFLWQLPGNLRFDPDRVAGFLEMLPRDTEELARMARRHDERVAGRAWTEADRRRVVRHALEIRNETFLSPEMVRIARRTSTALVFSHASRWPYTEEITAGFVYLRLHGGEVTYASRYEDDELDRWADRIRRWRNGAEPNDPVRITDRKPPRRKSRDVYAYFDNDAWGHAPHDAVRLAERVTGRS